MWTRAKKILEAIDDVVTVAVADATNQLYADIQEDTFTKGVDKDGEKIGSYKNTFWKKKREKTGKQVGFVDLNFDGDLKAGVQRDDSKIYFANEYAKVVGRGNEDRYKGGGSKGAGKGEIFGAGKARKETAIEIIKDHVRELFNG